MMKKLLLLTATSFAVYSNALSQIQIFPANPSNIDSVRIVKHAVTNYDGELIDSSVWRSNENIIVNVCYSLGVFASPMAHYDTINLGVLPAGNYNLNFVQQYSYSYTMCDFNGGTYYEDTTFSVSSSPFASNEDINQENEVSIFPNPSNGVLNFRLNTSMDATQIEVFDFMGKCVEKRPFNDKVNLNLDAGTYIIHIKNEDAILCRRQIVLTL